MMNEGVVDTISNFISFSTSSSKGGGCVRLPTPLLAPLLTIYTTFEVVYDLATQYRIAKTCLF